MALHENLRELVARLGPQLLSDAAGLRAALSDWVDDDAASAGDINLLVGAVESGALDSLLTMLDVGAEPARALDEVGLRFAAEGSFDPASACWALACLGFAGGRVDERLVQQHAARRPGRARTWQPPAPVTQRRPDPLPPPPPGPPPPGPPPPGPPPGWAPPPPRRRRGLVLAVVGVVVLAVLAVGGVGFVVLRGSGGSDDDPGDAGGSGGTSSGSTDSSTDLPSIDARFSALSRSVTASAGACESADPADGEAERLTCTLTRATLDLVRYESEDDATAARDDAVTRDIGTVSQDYADGTSFFSSGSRYTEGADAPVVRWDSPSELVAATLTGDDDLGLGQLYQEFRITGPRIRIPKDVRDGDLRRFVRTDGKVSLTSCQRTPTTVADELEEDYCPAEGDIYVYVAAFASEKAFRANRARIKDAWQQAGVSDFQTWSNTADVYQGAYFQYENSDSASTLYWDVEDCRCYALAFEPDGDHDALETWWEQN